MFFDTNLLFFITNKGVALNYDNTSKYRESIMCYEKALNSCDKREDIPAIQIWYYRTQIWYNMGAIYYTIHNYEMAIKCCDEGINTNADQNDIKPYPFQVEFNYTHVNKINELTFGTYYLKGLASDQLKRYYNATESYRNALALKPDDDAVMDKMNESTKNLSKFYYDEGVRHCDLKNYTEGLEYFNKSCELIPNQSVDMSAKIKFEWGNYLSSR